MPRCRRSGSTAIDAGWPHPGGCSTRSAATAWADAGESCPRSDPRARRRSNPLRRRARASSLRPGTWRRNGNLGRRAARRRGAVAATAPARSTRVRELLRHRDACVVHLGAPIHPIDDAVAPALVSIDQVAALGRVERELETTQPRARASDRCHEPTSDAAPPTSGSTASWWKLATPGRSWYAQRADGGWAQEDRTHDPSVEWRRGTRLSRCARAWSRRPGTWRRSESPWRRAARRRGG